MVSFGVDRASGLDYCSRLWCIIDEEKAEASQSKMCLVFQVVGFASIQYRLFNKPGPSVDFHEFCNFFLRNIENIGNLDTASSTLSS